MGEFLPFSGHLLSPHLTKYQKIRKKKRPPGEPEKRLSNTCLLFRAQVTGTVAVIVSVKAPKVAVMVAESPGLAVAATLRVLLTKVKSALSLEKLTEPVIAPTGFPSIIPTTVRSTGAPSETSTGSALVISIASN